MITLDDLKNSIDKFNVLFPRPNMEILELSEPYDIRCDFSWCYPGTGKPGVYAIFSTEGELLRIGKASCSNTLDKRLSTYYKWNSMKTRGVPKHSGYDQAVIIRTITFPKDRAFEAPALEEFLIGELNPPYQKIGLSNRL